VSTEEAQAYATEASLLFMEASAKTGDNVIECFTEIGTPFNYFIVNQQEKSHVS
jgi:hypothetical protein